MIEKITCKVFALIAFLTMTLFLTACGQKPETNSNETDQAQASDIAAAPITIHHKLGTTLVKQRPQRVAALDMNEVDFLSLLDVPLVGMPKDFVPQFLSGYAQDPNIVDLGAIVQPNMEHLYRLKPDLVLISSMQANHYEELSSLAPTLHFDVDYRNSNADHFEIVNRHLLQLGQIFGKEALAQTRSATFMTKVAEAKAAIQARPEKALVILHNNGAYRYFGTNSRYGFVYQALGVKPANTSEEASLHGQPISSEFIYENNPDIIYMVDRTAIMEHRPTVIEDHMTNPLIRETKAWKNGHVVFVDSEAWYIMGASISSLETIIEDVLEGYQ